jgi:hypothetical protein
MGLEDWRTVAQIMASVFTAIGVIGGLWLYRRNPRLERARWVSSLYDKFYESDRLKKIRNALDVPPDSDAINTLVIEFEFRLFSAKSLSLRDLTTSGLLRQLAEY